MTREQQLFAAAKYHLEMFRPFTTRPIGAPGSPARLEQEAQIEAHQQLKAAIARYEGGAS